MKKNRTSIEIYNAGIIGSLFILAFPAYGFGRQFFESESLSEIYIGAGLILMNSGIVIFIGVLFRKTLRQYSVGIGTIYLFARVFEAIALSSILLNLIPGISIPYDLGYFLAMLVLGLGSIPMCLILYKHSITSQWFAIWGVMGYTIFGYGFLMELFGKEMGMNTLILGGFWEITFATWLILKK